MMQITQIFIDLYIGIKTIGGILIFRIKCRTRELTPFVTISVDLRDTEIGS